MKNQKGFTLIELLIVLAIIAIIATIGSIYYPQQMKKARDAQRKTDLQQIRAALEMYYSDHGEYPSPGCYDGNCILYSSSGALWIPGLAPYLNGRVPVDPINNADGVSNYAWITGNYGYIYGNVGLVDYPGAYDLTAQLENTNDPDRCGVKDWKLYFDNHSWCTAFGGSYSNQIYENSPE